MKVYVLEYVHKYGNDIMVYTTNKLATEAAREIEREEMYDKENDYINITVHTVIEEE